MAAVQMGAAQMGTMVDSCRVHFDSTYHNSPTRFHTTATKKNID